MAFCLGISQVFYVYIYAKFLTAVKIYSNCDCTIPVCTVFTSMYIAHVMIIFPKYPYLFKYITGEGLHSNIELIHVLTTYVA
jgi:hypothetical protein